MIYKSFEKLIDSLRKRQFVPVYFIDGEEPYYIEKITEYFSGNLLPESDRDFNLITFYGKDVKRNDVLSACRRLPMFAERQVVIVKDAAQMSGLGELDVYIQNPSPTTILLLEHRFKKVDGRSKLSKLLVDPNVAWFTSEKIKEEALPNWIQQYGQSINFSIGLSEAQLLASFLGADLERIVNEITKIRINSPDASALTLDLIQKQIGISREYNIYELPGAFTTGNRDKVARMLHYMLANPKIAPMPAVVGTFAFHLSQLYNHQYQKARQEKVKWTPPDVQMAMQRMTIHQTEQAWLIVAEFSEKAVGIGGDSEDSSLLKEMMGKLDLMMEATAKR